MIIHGKRIFILNLFCKNKGKKRECKKSEQTFATELQEITSNFAPEIAKVGYVMAKSKLFAHLTCTTFAPEFKKRTELKL